MSDTEECTCPDPLKQGRKLRQCGSDLCKAIKSTVKLQFNRHILILERAEDNREDSSK